MREVKLPAHWQLVPLGDVARIDRRTVAPEDIVPGTFYVGLEDISSSGEINNSSVERGELKSSKFEFDERHVLYGKLRPYLRKVACPGSPGICSTDIIPILPGKHLDRRYLYYYLRQSSMVELATLRSSGVNLPRLGVKVLLGFPVALPSLAEQRRIVSILGEAERIYRACQSLIQSHRHLVDSLFHSTFGRVLASDSGCPRVRLAELLLESPQNGLYRPASCYGRGTPIVRIDSFQQNESIEVGDLHRVDLDDASVEKYRLESGDFLVNRVNAPSHLGKSAVAPAADEPVVFESNMMRLRLCQTRLSPVYLMYLFGHASVRNQISQMSRDSVNQSSINQTDVQSIRVVLPPIAQQREFEARVSAIERARAAPAAQSELANGLFRSLSQSAFCGQLGAGNSTPIGSPSS